MLHLITEDEFETLTFGRPGSQTTFSVKRLHGGHKTEIERASTVKGRRDHALYEKLLADAMIHGWTGLLSRRGGAELKYENDAELKRRVLKALPAGVMLRIEAVSLMDEQEEVEALGNSEPSSPNG